MTLAPDPILVSTTLTITSASSAAAAEDRSGSEDQAVATIIIGLFTLIATVTVMYLIARGGRRR